ncbi:serine/threonine-kinase pkn1 domain protein, partial [Chlamydia psittaci C1/97]
ENAV